MPMTWIRECLEYTPIAHVTGTVAATALSLTDFGFTAAQVAAANVAVITTATAAILYRVDGAVPVIATPSGHLLPTGVAPWSIWGRTALDNFQMIRNAGGVSAVVSITLGM